MVTFNDQQNPFAFAQWQDNQAGEPGHSGLGGRAVARHQRPAALGQPRHHLPQRRAEQPGLALDQVRAGGPDVLQVRSLARCLGCVAPAILHRGSQPRRRGDRGVVLARRVPQDFQHLGGAGRAGGNECGAGRAQPVPADHLGVCRSLWCQAITLVIGVPAQFHVPHERVLPRRDAVMPVIAAITPGALTAGQVRRPRGVVSRPGRERPQAAGDHPAAGRLRRAGNGHRPRRRIRVMLGSPAR